MDDYLKCLDSHVYATWWCSGAQGGAVLAKKSKGLSTFVSGWRQAYLDEYAGKPEQPYRKNHDGQYGGDQRALMTLMAESCGRRNFSFGYLPQNFNERAVEPLKCPSASFGHTFVVHHKHYIKEGHLHA